MATRKAPKKTAKKGKEQEAFEEVYRRLEETVSKLEQGGLSLEESLGLYEEGMTLARRCQQMLDAAELRITKLREAFLEEAPSAAETPPEPEEDEGL